MDFYETSVHTQLKTKVPLRLCLDFSVPRCNKINFVRFEVLTAVSMKMAVFWVTSPCSLVEVYRRFRDACCLHHEGIVTIQNKAIFEINFSFITFVKFIFEDSRFFRLLTDLTVYMF
jgi:hypothetical protein